MGMHLLAFERETGRRVLVNPKQIQALYDDEDTDEVVYICFVGGKRITVKGSLETVAAMVRTST